MHAWQGLNGEAHIASLDPNYAPAGLLEMVAPTPRRILDIGCFCGGSGRWLKRRYPGVSVTGIEKLEKPAALASQAYDRVIVGDLDAVDFDDPQLGRFDAIVAADVFEHLADPWKLIVRLRALLSPGGALHVSLPNIRNAIVLQDLIRGDFRYEAAGILDVTHLRFFTRGSAIRMFEETGWRVAEQRINIDPRLQPLFAGRDIESIDTINLEKATLHNLTPSDMQELVALQFYFRLVPAAT